MKDKPNRAEVGKTGEDVACKYLKKHGYKLIERNYWKKWGEIDVVAIKDTTSPEGLRGAGTVYHFVEVKSVSGRRAGYDPEENVHPWKLKRLSRAIQTYILSKKLDEKEWQVDLLAVFLSLKDKKTRIKIIENIIFL